MREERLFKFRERIDELENSSLMKNYGKDVVSGLVDYLNEKKCKSSVKCRTLNNQGYTMVKPKRMKWVFESLEEFFEKEISEDRQDADNYYPKRVGVANLSTLEAYLDKCYGGYGESPAETAEV